MKKHKNFNQVFPYTYYIKHIETGIKYYGVRWANCNKNKTPNEDFLNIYFTSIISEKYRWFKELLIKDKTKFEYKIHYTFDTKKDAQKYESMITKKVYRRDGWANLCSSTAMDESCIPKEEMSRRKKLGHAKRKGIKRNLSIDRIEQLRMHVILNMQNSGEKHPSYGTHLSIETRSKISKSVYEFHLKNPGFTLGSKNGMYGSGKNYKAISPDGIEYIITEGIIDFLKEHNLHYTGMINFINNKQKTHKGWKFFILPSQD